MTTPPGAGNALDIPHKILDDPTMGQQDLDNIRQMVHSELEQFSRGKYGFDVHTAVKTYWPVLVVAIAGLVWLIRLEAKVDNHETREWHAGMSKTALDIATIKADVKHLREDLIEVKKRMETTNSLPQ